MSQDAFLARIVKWLEQAGIPFMVAGSLGSSYYGQPRTTNDFDLIVDPNAEQLANFLSLLENQCYVSQEDARDAFRRRSMFNVIDFESGWKADLIVRKDRPFSVEEFRRRQPGVVYNCRVPVASPEDIILTKLEWDKITPSERQLRDALSVTAVQWSRLDRAYLRHWAAALGVAEKLEDLLRTAESLQEPTDDGGS